MNTSLFPVLAFAAGAGIAIQASLSALLGSQFRNPVFATAVTLLFSFLFTICLMAALGLNWPSTLIARQVPLYLWIVGGLLSAFALSTFYWLIPEMGVGPMVSFALAGQLITAIIAGHFGWFHLPVAPINVVKALGALVMIAGIYMINRG